MTTNQQEFIRLCSRPAVQEKIREGMRDFRDTDWIYCLKCESTELLAIHSEQYACGEELDNLIHLPQVHDLQNPERGLEGMLNGAVIIYRSYGMRQWRVNVTTDDECRDFIGDTPELALIRALMWQWGIETEQDEDIPGGNENEDRDLDSAASGPDHNWDH